MTTTGGSRAGSGRKPLAEKEGAGGGATTRITVNLDEATGALLRQHGTPSRGAFARIAMTTLLGELAADVTAIPATAGAGAATVSFALKAPSGLISAAKGYCGGGKKPFRSMSEFVRTAITRLAARTTA